MKDLPYSVWWNLKTNRTYQIVFALWAVSTVFTMWDVYHLSNLLVKIMSFSIIFIQVALFAILALGNYRRHEQKIFDILSGKYDPRDSYHP